MKNNGTTTGTAPAIGRRNLDVSATNPNYFEDAGGATFIPVGLNLAFVRNAKDMPEAEVLETYRRWLRRLAENGGNFARVWLGTPFFNVSPNRAGEYDRANLGHILEVLQMAGAHGIKLKLTLEHFRTIATDAAPGENTLFPGAVTFVDKTYASICRDMEDFLNSDAARAAFLDKAAFLAENGVAASDAVAVIEPWNEFDSISAPVAARKAWSRFIMKRLAELFPRQMVVQNLGSFSEPATYKAYDWLASEGDSCFLQVHRYFDPGAALDVCRGPMDVLSADAVRELKQRRPDMPALLAEGGAVEAHHALFSKRYEADTEGEILHDVIFAPFFAGAAGSGQPWHWDHIYVERHDLYHHFARFAKAVADTDPVRENFQPFYTETPQTRVYGLRGKNTGLAWCRAKTSAPVEGDKIPIDDDACECGCYDPWKDAATAAPFKDGWVFPPTFQRSIVIKIKKQERPQ